MGQYCVPLSITTAIIFRSAMIFFRSFGYYYIICTYELIIYNIHSLSWGLCCFHQWYIIPFQLTTSNAKLNNFAEVVCSYNSVPLIANNVEISNIYCIYYWLQVLKLYNRTVKVRFIRITKYIIVCPPALPKPSSDWTIIWYFAPWDKKIK